MKKLPDHTTRHFARQAYYSAVMTGRRGPWKYKTVQGVDLTVQYNNIHHSMMCSYEIGGVTVVKSHRCARSWIY